MTVRQLPIMKIGDTSYFVDDRLQEFRNVNNPHDRLTLVEAYAKAKGLDAGFCESCGCVIILNIERFKNEHCTSCDQFKNDNCRGANEEITECKVCCESSFLEGFGGFCGDSGRHNEDKREDREESDLQIGKG